MRENIRHASRSFGLEVVDDVPGRGACCGVMSGSGATLRSGRVRVFARRMVVVECGGRCVRMGMSDGSSFRDMLRGRRQRRALARGRQR